MKILRRQGCCLLGLIMVWFCFAPSVEAAKLRLLGPEAPVAVGQEMRIDLVLDPEGQDLNAVGVRVNWPAELELLAILDAQSIVSLWTERPRYDGQDLILSGVIPGGYTGSYSPGGSTAGPGIIVSVLAKSKRVGKALIAVSEAELYPNDGSGEVVYPDKERLMVKSSESLPVMDLVKAKTSDDKNSPQGLVASIERDALVADNQWFVTFSAYDQESGIKNFYIDESKNPEPSGDWLVAGRPFILIDQSRSSYVFIKAVDWNGNEALISLAPASSSVSLLKLGGWWWRWWLIAMIVVGVIALAYLIKKIRRHYL